MLFSKSNIYAKDWLDTVFANRNKEYGAYQLRQMSGKATNWALLIVMSAVVGVCGLTYARSSSGYINPKIIDENVVVVELMNDEVADIIEVEEVKKETTELPKQVAQDVPARDVVKFTEINPTEASNVREDVVAVDEVMDKKKLLGSIKMDGMKGGDMIATNTFGKEKREGAARGVREGSLTGTAESSDPFVSVEVMPEPIGGMKAFVDWVAKNYNFPQSAIDAAAKGAIVVSFVVEKDGSLTAFDVTRDLGYGTGDAAVSLLKKAKKWNPGIQNGRPVRVNFTLPIRLDVSQM